MGWLWRIFVDDEDLAVRMQREINHSKFIISIKEQIGQTEPIINENFDSLRQEFYERISRMQVDFDNTFNDRLRNTKRTLQAELEGMAREILANLQQEIHEEISQVQVDLDKKIAEYSRAVESKIKLLPKPINSTITPNLRQEIQSEILRVQESELKKMAQDISRNLQQEIHEEISQIQVDLIPTFERRLQVVESELEKISTNPSPKHTVDLVALQNTINQLLAENQRQALRLNQLEKKFNSAPPPVVSTENDSALRPQIELLNRNIENANRTIIIQSKNIESLKSANKSLQECCDNQDKLIADLTKKIEKLEQQQPEASSPVKVQSTEPWINYFSIPRAKSTAAYFAGDSETIKAKFAQSIQEMDTLITNLTQAEIEEPAKTSFLRNLRGCMRDLENLYSKFNFASCDEDELSEAITNKFFKVIGDDLLDNVVLAIYRGGESARSYKNFLKKVNSYLSKHGIYTEVILPGTLAEGNILSNIEPPISKKTTVAADDGKIDEVELLPYFMNYNDDNGKVDTIRKRGRVICLKFGA